MTGPRTIRDVLASHADRYAVRREIRTNDRNAVHEVRLDERRAACKRSSANPEQLAREGAVLDAVAGRTPVSVPAVVGRGEGYLLLDWADGEAYDATVPLERRRERLRAVGRTLAALHDATDGWFDGHGDLTAGDGPPTVADPCDWPTRFLAFVDEWTTPLEGTTDSDVAAAVREFVAANCDAFADEPSVLVHGEPAPEHVRFDGARVASVVDWELAQAAPGGFDLSWATRQFVGGPAAVEPNAALAAALRDGYDDVRPLSPGAGVRRGAYRAGFAMRALKHVETIADRVDTDPAALRASMRATAFAALDDAATELST